MRILHVGCGGDTLPPWLSGEETRLDIDERCNPDIVASMIDMGDIGGFDIIYCSHALEHLPWHEVKQALEEFKRVLKDGGQAVIIVPDLEDIKPNDEVVYQSLVGPVAGLDMYFGMRKFLKDNPFMAHRSGFVSDTLASVINECGFANVMTRRVPDFNLLAIATK